MEKDKELYDDEELSQSSWNLSQAEIMTLSRLGDLAINQSLNGQSISCFYTTKEIRGIINHDLSVKEREVFDKLEKKLQINIGSLRKEGTTKLHEFTRELIRYRLLVRKVLAKYGYLIGKKSSQTEVYD